MKEEREERNRELERRKRRRKRGKKAKRRLASVLNDLTKGERERETRQTSWQIEVGMVISNDFNGLHAKCVQT